MSSLVHLSIIIAGLGANLPWATPKVFETRMSPRVVETQYGKLRGVLVTLTNRTLPQVEAYLGLQYASLLEGDLRFMPPTSTVEKWDGVRVALKFRAVCPQRIPTVEELEARMPKVKVDHLKRILPFLETQVEDCLNLNIYVPVRDRSDASLLPVLIFVHGETFELGSGNPYDGSALSAYGHVIVVTINYRLGVLGFLSTGDSSAPGNYALLDQIAALRWIQENIRPFGGNKSDVTLLGHGHGAVLVNLLMISPVTKGRNLFQRVILQSGTALSSWSTVSDALGQALRLADRLNCSTAENSSPLQTLLQCLKRLPFKELIDRTHSDEAPSMTLGPLPGASSSSSSAPFGPTVDRRSVILNDVRTSMAEVTSDSVFGNVTLLVGFTAHEAGAFFNDTIRARGLTVDAMREAVATLVDASYLYHRQAINEVLMHQYRDWDGVLDDGAVWYSLVDLLGDALFVVPAFEVGLYHSARGSAKTFLYCFNFTTSSAGRTDSTAKGAESTAHREDAWHGDDLTYIFAAPITDGIDPFPSVYTKSEKSFAETILKFWINFIKTGSPSDPSPERQHLPPPPPAPTAAGARLKGRPTTESTPEWPEFDAERQEVMILDSRSHSRRQFRASRLALWLNLIPKIHRPDDPEVCDEPRGPTSNTVALSGLNQSLHQISRRPHCSTVSAKDTVTQTLLQRLLPQRGLHTPSSAGMGPLQRTSTTLPLSAITAHRKHPVGEASERRGLKTSSTQLDTPLRGTNFAGANFGGTNFDGQTPPNEHELMQVERPPRADVEPTTTQGDSSLRGGSGGTSSDQGVALVVVVAVGCFLLALNLLLFLCVYRKKLRRWRERRKRRKTDEEEAEEKGELTEQSYGLKGSAAGRAIANGPDADKCSHYLTPIPSHHHLYCQMTSLQNSLHASA